jgi:hypothetical protein
MVNVAREDSPEDGEPIFRRVSDPLWVSSPKNGLSKIAAHMNNLKRNATWNFDIAELKKKRPFNSLAG